jgi:hypothetical protein
VFLPASVLLILVLGALLQFFWFCLGCRFGFLCRFLAASSASALLCCSLCVGLGLVYFGLFFWRNFRDMDFLSSIIFSETNQLCMVSDGWAPFEIQYLILSALKEFFLVKGFTYPKSSTDLPPFEDFLLSTNTTL